jgi:hypothetical protein
MKVNNLKEYKNHKETQQEIEKQSLELTRQFMEYRLFNQCVRPWTRFLLKHFKFIRDTLQYQISIIDNNINKMMITRVCVFGKKKGQRICIAKTF